MNRRFKITALLFTTIAISAFAQDDKDSTKLWSRGGVVRLQFSQASLTNWAAGGESSIAGTSFLSLFANYAKGKVNWDNTVDLAYGLQKLGTGNWVKSDDKIDLSSKLGIKAKNAWFYSAQLSFKSQFAPGYKLPNDSVVIADFLSPAYVLASLGMDYKPNKDFSLLIAPLTGKVTYVKNQTLANAGAFGVEAAVTDANGKILTPGKNLRSEFGGYVKLAWTKKLMENVNFTTKLDLFSNYLNNPQNIDVNWETLLDMKINSFLSASLITQLLYDDDVTIEVSPTERGPRTQFKEVLGVGLTVKLGDKR